MRRKGYQFACSKRSDQTAEVPCDGRDTLDQEARNPTWGKRRSGGGFSKTEG